MAKNFDVRFFLEIKNVCLKYKGTNILSDWNNPETEDEILLEFEGKTIKAYGSYLQTYGLRIGDYVICSLSRCDENYFDLKDISPATDQNKLFNVLTIGKNERFY